MEGIPDWDENYTEITKQKLQTLKNHRDRTGIAPQKLLQDKADIPQGLNLDHVKNILFSRTKRTKRIYFEYVLHEWEKLPDKNSRVAVTPNVLEKIQEQKIRTGIGTMALLHDTKNDRPQGLTAGIIDGWLKGLSKSARQDHLNYVLEKYKSLPDVEK